MSGGGGGGQGGCEWRSEAFVKIQKKIFLIWVGGSGGGGGVQGGWEHLNTSLSGGGGSGWM